MISDDFVVSFRFHFVLCAQTQHSTEQKRSRLLSGVSLILTFFFRFYFFILRSVFCVCEWISECLYIFGRRSCRHNRRLLLFVTFIRSLDRSVGWFGSSSPLMICITVLSSSCFRVFLIICNSVHNIRMKWIYTTIYRTHKSRERDRDESLDIYSIAFCILYSVCYAQLYVKRIIVCI